jgi:hypothetical protein
MAQLVRHTCVNWKDMGLILVGNILLFLSPVTKQPFDGFGCQYFSKTIRTLEYRLSECIFLNYRTIGISNIRPVS